MMRIVKTVQIAAVAAWLFQIAPAQAAAPEGFETLAENLLPTVVNVSTTTKIADPRRGEMPPMPELPPGSPFEDFFKDFYDRYKRPPGEGGEDEKVSALGSGFIIDAANGYVVTNNHVIKDADEIKIILHNDETLDATLVGTDEKTDIAVLKVKPDPSMIATQWGDSDQAKVGSWILAIGNPFGLGGTVTAGIVSARQRDINAGPYDDFIQTDASINRGNSGGPMFNMKGEVVGINTAIFSPSGGSVGIGFAVPSNLVKSVVEQLVKYGKTKRGWLGVRIQIVTPEIAETLQMGKARGAMVAGVTENGPSDEAGLKSGDVILTFDGHNVDTSQKLPRMVAETEVGKKVNLTVWRKGKEELVTVTLGQLETAEESGMIEGGKKPTKEDDKKPAAGTELPAFGMTLSPITEKLRTLYGIGKEQKGAVVTDVKRNGAASEKGIAAGDLIAEVDQTEVTSPEDVVAKVEEAKAAKHGSVLFFIARKSDRRFVALKLKDK
ncbi:MAG: DegQ family serine endoprotease [Alphaproteobacteria bacterium]